ncbi:MAG: GNAT family N-acetyltransferase [Candidatus Hodarchaeota archaeon]
MTTNKVNLIISQNWIIPEKLLEEYASIMALSKNEGELTKRTKEYLIQRLKRLHNIPVPDNARAFNIIPIINDKIVGWGHLSWSTKGKEKEWNEGELYVYVIPGERQKGLGTRMCRKLLEKIPSYAGTLMVQAPKEEFGSLFAQKKLGATLVKEEERLVSKIRQFSREDIYQKAEQHRQMAEEQGLKLHFVTGETLEQDIDFQAFVQLTEQTMDDNPDDEWTEEEMSKKAEQYRQMLKNGHERGIQYWNYLAIEKTTGKLVGYTQTILNFEGDLISAIDNKTGVLNEYSETGLALSLKYQVLERLLRETKVIYWINYHPQSNEYLVKIASELGFEYFNSHCTYDLTRENWEKFLKNN